MSDWKPAHAPTFDTRESLSAPRGDRVLIFSDFDRAEPHFFRVSNLVDFHYFSIFFDIFRTYTHLTIVQNCLPKRLGVALGLRERSTSGAIGWHPLLHPVPLLNSAETICSSSLKSAAKIRAPQHLLHRGGEWSRGSSFRAVLRRTRSHCFRGVEKRDRM